MTVERLRPTAGTVGLGRVVSDFSKSSRLFYSPRPRKNKAPAQSADEAGLIRSWQEYGHLPSRNKLAQELRKLCRAIARKYRQPNDPDFEDLIQEGFIGVTVAIDRYRVEHGASLKTYASFWVRAAQSAYVRKLAKGSADEPLENGDGESDLAGTRMPLDERTSMRIAYDRAIVNLPSRDQEVFFLKTVEERTFKEIGATLGITAERARQIHQRAIRKMKERIS